MCVDNHNKLELTGIVICDRCNTSVQWYYILPQKISNGQLFTVSHADGTIFASRTMRISQNVYKYAVRCPFCDNKIEFTYEK